MAKKLEVEIIADASKYAKGLKDAESKTSKFGKAAGVAGAALAGGLVVGMKKSVDAAMESQKVQSATEAQLKSLGIGYKSHAKQIDAAVASTSKLAAVDDEDLQSSFNRLLPATKNVSTALEDMKVAADVSRARNISLESATNLVAKANMGGATALKKLGIQMSPVTAAVDKLKAGHDKFTAAQMKAAKETDRNAQSQANLAKLQQTFGGAAEAYGKTAAGSQERLGIAIENLEESMGKLLLPIVTKVAGAMANLAGYLEKHTTLAKVLVGLVGGLAGVLIGVSVATKVWAAATKAAAAMQWLLNTAMDANPIGLVVIAVAALAAGLVIAYKKSETFRNIVDGAFGQVKAVFDDLVEAGKAVARFFTTTMPAAFKATLDWVRQHWPEIATLISGPFAPLVALATDSFGVRSKLIAAFTAIKTFVSGAVKDVAKFITDLPSKIGDFGAKLLSTFTGFFTGAGIGAWVEGRVTAWAGFIHALPGRIANFGADLAAKITGFISGADIGAKISAFIGRWAGFFGDIPEAVGRAVKGKAQALWDNIKGIFDKLPAFIRHALDIHSPSKEFEAIGIAIMEGAIQGIKGLKDTLLDAAMEAFGPLVDVGKDVIDKIGGLFHDNTNPQAAGKVMKMYATAQAIDAKHYPYAWGGGHNAAFAPSGATDGAGTFGYDCSGAVSAVLHSAGLIGSPMVSGALAGWGGGGFGRYVTIFADAVHTFMVIAGQGFGTGTANPGGGAGWLPYNTPYRGGFATRHPVGLATGGIVTAPTLALVGERGPEAVIPLSRGMGATVVNVNMPHYLGNVRDAARQIRDELTRMGIRNGISASNGYA